MDETTDDGCGVSGVLQQPIAVPPNASFLLGNGSFPDPDTDDGGTNANGDDDGAVHCSDIRIWGSNVGSGSGGGSGSDHDADDDALYCPLLEFLASPHSGLSWALFFLSVLGATCCFCRCLRCICNCLCDTIFPGRRRRREQRRKEEYDIIFAAGRREEMLQHGRARRQRQRRQHRRTAEVVNATVVVEGDDYSDDEAGEGYNAYDDYDSNVNYYSEGEGVLPLEEALVIASRIPDDETAIGGGGGGGGSYFPPPISAA